MRRFVLVLLMLAGTVAATAPLQAQASRPNIIFFLVDDLSSDLLKYMDNTRSLADNGTRFANYFVSNSLCCPSRASMFTGEHPHNTGVLTNEGADNGGYPAFERHEMNPLPYLPPRMKAAFFSPGTMTTHCDFSSNSSGMP